ncbi:MAG: hypothetical protein JNK43_06745 [Ignavibacteria bacterium]|nr:hypothetical protein [Ignavibacteria bacterium]
MKFLTYLSSVYPNPSENEISDETVYREVYGREKLNTQVVKNLLHRTTGLCEKYLVELALRKDRFAHDTLLVNELQRRKLVSYANKKAEKAIIFQDQNEEYTISFLKKKYDLLELKHQLTESHDSKFKIASNSNKLSASLKYLLVSVLRTLNDYEVNSFVEAHENRNVYIDKIDELLNFEKVLEIIKHNEPEDYPLLACYYYGLLSKTNDPGGLYREKLKQISFENIERFRHVDNIEFWQMIFAAYIFSRSSKGPVDVKTLHDINKMYVNRGVIYRDENGFVSENNYHNIAMQAIGSKDFEWAEEFISSYKDQLEPSVRENTYNFLMGYFNVTKGDYNNVIQYLSRIKSHDIPVNLTVRWMLIRTYYELGHYFEAESAIDAFKKFITSSGRVTRESISSYPLLLKLTAHLIRAKTSGKGLKEEMYLKAINTPIFIGRSWVLEKMEEMKGPPGK